MCHPTDFLCTADIAKNVRHHNAKASSNARQSNSARKPNSASFKDQEDIQVYGEKHRFAGSTTRSRVEVAREVAVSLLVIKYFHQ